MMKPCKNVLTLQIAVLCLLFSSLGRAQTAGEGIPIIKITPEGSTVTFNIKSSMALSGTFDKWDATITFTSADVNTGVLDIKIEADSVDTGSGMKNGKLKSKDFFNAKEDPYITFHSTKVVQTSPTTVELPGTFTIRGISKPETATFTVTGKGTGVGAITGTMAFDRKDYDMTHGIPPFIKVADRVEVSINLKGKRVSGPPLVFKE
jgi:polyisoprenoid-binding protein YceI